ncbi:MAG TPA: Ig-like domain-containing protein [Micromonosporaceae bacterium]|nr:Ig-like domain-containing protein [Micromonosporaceae bacterium]
MPQRPRIAALLIVCVLGLTTACSSHDNNLWKDNGDNKPKGPQITATVTNPKANATNVPASVEIEYATANANSATFELKDTAGKVVEGQVRPGTTTWVPATTLEYGTSYTTTVTATGAEGKTATTTSSFTTMAKPSNTVRVSSNIGDDNVVGVGMPMVLRFSRAVPDDLRDDVERRLWVSTTPAQVGSWHWYSDTELHYRPQKFWQAGTKLNFRIGTGGLALGGGFYGRADITVVASVGEAVVLTVDNATKQMTVTKNGKVIKMIPVSLGRPGMPSSSGTTVIMEKLRNTIFDTHLDPNPANRYITPVEYAQRLTWGGEFIHAAPWSEDKQGHVNVSHGCVNVSMVNAAWLFSQTLVGTPVTIKGTERALQQGNGWTDWSLSWEEYQKGSALPAAPPTVTPTPTG